MRILRLLFAYLLSALLLLAASACGRSAEQYLAQGKQYLAKGQAAEAIVVLRNATSASPDMGEAHAALGEAYLAAKDLERAAVEFVNAGSLMPTSLEAQLRAGEVMLLGRHFPEAQDIARRALLLDPKSIRALVLSAHALAGMNRHDQALAAIERAIQLDPTRADTAGDLGALQLTGKTPEQAERSFKRMIELDPALVDGHISLGSFYWVQGRLGEAESELRQAYEMAPAHVGINRALATFYLGTNRARQAEQYLRVAVEGTPTTAARLTMADYYLSLGRTAEAERLLEKAAESPDGFGESRSRLAVIKYDAGKAAAAHALIDDTLKKDPANSRALLTKAGFLLAEEKTALAFERATAAVRTDPNSLPAHYMLAQINKQLGDPGAAELEYASILRIQPASVAAQMEMAALHMARGAPEAAVKAAEAAARVRPDNVDARSILLRSLISSGELERASALLGPLLKQAGHRADLQWMAGMLELSRKNRIAARSYFERSLALEPDAFEPLDGLIALDLADGRGGAARARLDAQLARRPRSTALLVLAGRVYSAVNDFSAAESALKTAISVDAMSQSAFDELARVYAVQGQLDRGAREVEAMARRTPESAGPPMMLGAIMELRGRPIEAQAWFEKALVIEPLNAIVANNLAWLYADQGGDLDAALELALMARQQLAQRPDIADTLGWVYYKRNEPSQALPFVRQAVQQDPGNPVFQYHLGLVYAKMGDTTRARDALVKAVGRNVEFQGVANARAVLASLQ
jgi:tetratricopeptide (TPR) repeat protein